MSAGLEPVTEPAHERYLRAASRWLGRPRAAEALLGAAMALSVVAMLWFGRGNSFSADEMAWVGTSPGLSFNDALQPHWGHLLLVTRYVYKGLLEIFGLAYLPYRLLTVATILLTVGLVFVYLRRRVGDLAALAPCLVLLFFGSDSHHMLYGNGFTVVLSVAVGVAALLAVERDDRPGDLAACGLLTLGVLTYANTLAFAVGIAVLMLIGERRRRVWIAIVPLALYVSWRVWLQVAGSGDPGGELILSNLLLVPNWTFQSLSGVVNALTGLGYDFGSSGPADGTSMVGPVLAVAALVGLALRFSRGPVRRLLLATIATALALWTMQALVGSGLNRAPGGASRYLYPNAIVVLLVAAEAAAGWRPRRPQLIAIFCVAAIGVATNLAYLRDNGARFRSIVPAAKTTVGALQLRSGDQGPSAAGGESPSEVSRDPISHMAAMADLPYGRYGYTPPELSRQSEELREQADAVLASGVKLTRPASPPAAGTCLSFGPGSESGDGVEVPRAGALIIAEGSSGTVRLGRFADRPTVDLGAVAPGHPKAIVPPADASSVPWKLAVTGSSIRVCGLR